MSSNVAIPKFPSSTDSLYSDLKKKVQQYFSENNKLTTGNIGLYSKALLMVVLFVGVYVQLLIFNPSWLFLILEFIILGILIAGIGFNVMHDGSHGSFSKYKWKNILAACSVNIVGGNHFMWNIKHNMIHHSFTNVDGLDDDIQIGKLMRLAPTQQRLWLHKFQHIYFWFLYSQLYVFWVFFTDYKKYFSKKIGSIPLKKMNIKNHFGFWTIKVYHAVVFIVLPIICIGWLKWMVGFIIMASVSGFILSIVFQLAHTVEDTIFPIVNETNNQFPDYFAEHQIKTTANFATHNKIISWFVGGLNFQIEHHLFPKISHVHYPAISKIVKQVCLENQITYIEYPTMSRAIVAHIRFLKQLGNQD